MLNDRSALLVAMILGSLTAVLAWTAVVITYSRRGEVNFGTLFGGLFGLALAIGAWSRRRTRVAP